MAKHNDEQNVWHSQLFRLFLMNYLRVSLDVKSAVELNTGAQFASWLRRRPYVTNIVVLVHLWVEALARAGRIRWKEKKLVQFHSHLRGFFRLPHVTRHTDAWVSVARCLSDRQLQDSLRWPDSLQWNNWNKLTLNYVYSNYDAAFNWHLAVLLEISRNYT